MSTAVETPNVTANGSQPESTNTEALMEDVVVGTVDAKDEDGKPYKKPVLFDLKATEAEDFKTKYPTFEAAFQTTTKISKPKNIDGIKEITDNEEEIARLFFNGAKQKVNNGLTRALLEQDEEGNFVYQSYMSGAAEDESGLWNGSVMDLDVIVAAKPKRQSLTDEDKLRKTIAHLPQAAQDSVIAAFRAAKAMGA